jgi:hypothetical protein
LIFSSKGAFCKVFEKSTKSFGCLFQPQPPIANLKKPLKKRHKFLWENPQTLDLNIKTAGTKTAKHMHIIYHGVIFRRNSKMNLETEGT